MNDSNRKTNFERIAGNLDNLQNLCCEDPEVKIVLNARTGKEYTAQEAIGCNVHRAMELRHNLAEIIEKKLRPLYICPLCGYELRLNCMETGQRFYFQHTHHKDNCPQMNTQKWSREDILTAKYCGKRESEPHKQLKADLSSILTKDSSFSTIDIEKVVKGIDPTTWRKPDIRANFKNKFNIAFEIQLSTTFLDVVIGRKEFYKKKGDLLVWIFDIFTLNSARMMKLDTFHINNLNALVLDKETLVISRIKNKLHLKCIWVEPSIINNELCHTQKTAIIPFDQFQMSIPSQTIFHYDYKSHFEKAQKELSETQKAKQAQNRINTFFEKFDPAEEDTHQKLCIKLFPEFDLKKTELRWSLTSFLRSMNSARTKDPTISGSGWKYNNFKEIYDNVYKSHTQFYFLFCCATKAYGITEDSVSIIRRKKETWESLKQYGINSKFHHAPIFTELTAQLFPEVMPIYNEIMANEKIQKKCNTSDRVVESCAATPANSGDKSSYKIQYTGNIFEHERAAQWSVFFDYLKLPWTYSSEQINIMNQNISRDFNVYRHQCQFLILKKEEQRYHFKIYEELARLTGKSIVVIDGPPEEDGYSAYLYLHCKNPVHQEIYNNVIAGEPHHFGLARRSVQPELCLCPDMFDFCENHINLAQKSTDDGERPALDGLGSGLQEAYQIASIAKFD
ncbi:DUF6035 family protein [Desulfovibrio sp. JC022]|uniref:DUF6035 family protein n=1 Tax=Desulfovibrio sp. JC022 TaxID=2593642 RepID=UPI0013D7EBB9|nr:DUF6035 family protein [Desulfovibrio sp. JC022]NDV24734.1 hypothetical protein [Desulfovibrio sp. JC022]